MPLVQIHLVRGRSPADVRAVADAIHDAVVTAFSVPERDRYQTIHQHAADEIIAEDTGLGIDRSAGIVVVHVVSRARTTDQKQALYDRLRENLERDCGVGGSDLIVTIVENGDADWSFGHGRAQFLTGELT